MKNKLIVKLLNCFIATTEKNNLTIQQYSNSKYQKGFTLIEFITVTVVLASIGLVIVGILSSALRGTNKTNVVNNVRQNGNQAIIQMTKTIQNAKRFDGVSVDGNSYTLNCMQVPVAALTPTPTPTQYKYLQITAFDGEKITYNCTSDSIVITTATLNNVSLIDTKSVKLDRNICRFTCTQERVTSNTIIGIKFQLTQKAENGFVENRASIPFETSITFRNLVR